ncbi:MAG: 3-deoxy-7-phosphoheptulonate synthase [Desulfurococcales archaeon]|nr:3-deoxy-7-phosphoheptulonate synthase [Desulfurococcales archaeon]
MKECKLATGEPKLVVESRGVVIGGGKPVVIAGPCSVEDPEMIRRIASFLAEEIRDELGIRNLILRGGAWKPRTHPYSFQGHGLKALEWLKQAGEEAGIPVATEVMDPRDVEQATLLADFLWVGARNMQNTPLLRELGRSGKPVLLKRHFGAKIGEWICAAEYILAEGNERVALIERGTRGLNEYARFSLDLTVVPVVKRVSRLPLIVDVSHPAGERSLVPPLAYGSLAAGADGIMIEIHPDPDKALSDAKQQLPLEDFKVLASGLKEAGLL